MKSLAIIIPAYKKTFLKEALESIATQTCKDFTLYIGDDCSPYDLESIVNEYRNQIDLVYKRFSNNLGGQDLVAQWERCIDMSHNEPYIWLFSDDDVMEKTCVEAFLNLPEHIKKNYLIHFNIKIIEMDTQLHIKQEKPFPPILTAKQYLDGKLFGISHNYLKSFVVEFIFNRNLYQKSKGFQHFDLAWGSDFLTWVKMAGYCKGIYSINQNKACVYWRKSDENISPDKSKPVVIRKLHSLIENSIFIQQWLLQEQCKPSFFYSKFFWGELRRNCHILTRNDILSLYSSYRKKIGYPIWAQFSMIIIRLQKLLNNKKNKT